MKRLFCLVEPFKFTQNIHLFDDNIKVNTITASMPALSNALAECANEYDVDEIELTGSSHFCMKIKSETETFAITKFNKKNLKINII